MRYSPAPDRPVPAGVFRQGFGEAELVKCSPRVRGDISVANSLVVPQLTLSPNREYYTHAA